MANPYSRCGTCGGNMWPPAQVRDHVHIDNTILKKKYRTKPQGWNKAAPPRTNSGRNIGKTIRPRRRAYGPF